MEQSPYWEDNSFSANEEIPHILCILDELKEIV
jgi:hypothetical protein